MLLRITRLSAALALLGLFFSARQPVSAQFVAGASGGFYMVNVSGDAPSDATYRGLTTLTGSVILEYGIQPDVRLSVQPGFEKKGTTIAFDVPGTEDEVRDSVDIALNYVSVPVLARVITDGGGWYVTGGPVIGILSTATGTYEVDGREVDLVDSFKSTDLGAIFGIGHLFPIGGLETFLEFRFVQGLVNVSALEGSEGRIRNGGRQLLFGALYKLGS